MRPLFRLMSVSVLAMAVAGCGGKKEKAAKDSPEKKPSPKKVAEVNKQNQKTAGNKTPRQNKNLENKTTEKKTTGNKTTGNKTPSSKGAEIRAAEIKPPSAGTGRPQPADSGKSGIAAQAKKGGDTGKKKGGLKSLLGRLTGINRITAARTAARRMAQMNNLKWVGLAMHTHHDTYRGLPAAAIQDKDGKPLLSWRVKLLPYIEQEALYKEFHLDEPWDSPHNKKLIATMPPVYNAPLQPTKNGTTTMMLITGKQLPFGGQKGPRFRDITDGQSQTLMVVYAGSDKAVPWTKPADLEYKPGPPSATLGKIDRYGILCVMFDGATRTLKANMSAEDWKRLVDPQDGKPVDLDALSQ